LQQHRHLTLQLAWEEYRQVHPEGYGYSRFCGLYQRWRRKQDVVLRQVHQPGEKGFVDWAGATIPVHDPVTGEIWPASLFVMVLGTSSYTYAEATSPPARFCEPHRFGVERDRESGITCRFATEKKAWLGGLHSTTARFNSIIVSIVCSPKNSSRSTKSSCLPYVDRLDLWNLIRCRRK
jgi:hypothetical protein